MVIVDDATYVKMRDNLYWWDAVKAQKAKWQIEANYSDEKYSSFLTQLDSYTPKQSTPVEQKTETPANVVSDTPQNQPETPVSTGTEIKQEWELKPLSQEYYDQTSNEALNVIKDNLNNYKQTNPEYFTDYETFKNNFSYNARTQEQKDTLDQWYRTYQNWLSLSNTPTTELYTDYQNGNLSDTQLEVLRTTNPTKYNELLNQINKWNILTAYDDDKWSDVTNFQDMAYQMMSQIFAQFMTWWDSWASQYFREYEEKMNSPEMMSLSDQATEYENQIENIEDDIATMQKAVEKEYEWTWASRAKISAIVSDRTYDLQLQLRTANSNYKKVAQQYNNRMQQYQNEFQLQLQEYQVNMEARNQQMKELWFAMDLMSFETPQQQSERQWEYWVKQQEYTNWNINSKDYQTRYKAALTSVQNLLSEYDWIPMERSAEQMAEDILKAVDSWSTLWAELTKLNKQIQAKPEYKQLYNNTFGTWATPQTFTIWWKEYVNWNGQLMLADDFNRMYGWGNANAKWYSAVDSSKLSLSMNPWDKNLWKFIMQKANGMSWGQCWKYVNDYLEYIGLTWSANRYYDDDLSTKLNSVNSYNPTVWSVAVFDYWHKSSDGINHWHVGIVIWVDTQNGTITIKDSNFNGDEKVRTRTVSMNDPSLKGFFDPSKPYWDVSSNISAQETTSWWNKYIESEVWLYDAYINNWQTPTDAKLKSLWGGDLQQWWQVWNERVQDYMDTTWAWTLEKKKTDEVNKLRTEMHWNQAYTDYSQMQSYFQKIQNSYTNKSPDAYSDMSLIFAYMKMLDPKSIVRESEYATAANAWSIPTRIINMYNWAINGKKLTSEQRKEIYNASAWLMDWATYLYNNLLDDYTSMITYGWDASRLWKKWTYITQEYINNYGWWISWNSWDANLSKTVLPEWTMEIDWIILDSNWNMIWVTENYTPEVERESWQDKWHSNMPKVRTRS